MIFKPPKYEKYAKKQCERLTSLQNNFREEYSIDNYVNWFYNQGSETLRLYSDDKEVYFKYIPVGTFSLNSNTWMWSWANKSSLEPSRLDVLKIKEFGMKRNYSKLINPHFPGDKYTGWELTSIAYKLLGGIGTYRVVSDNIEKYFILSRHLSTEEFKEIDSKLIECNSHGKLRSAFICQHLNNQSKTGFYEVFNSFPGMKLGQDEDFQAWCDECEEIRIQNNGWTDDAMKFANVNLVCEECYFIIKDFNLDDKTRKH